MTPERYKQVKEVFLEALERPEGNARELFLADRCAGDADLDREVRALLVHHEDIDPAAVGLPPAGDTREQPTTPWIGSGPQWGSAAQAGSKPQRPTPPDGRPPTASRSRSSLRIDRGRFAPGTVVDNRYRVIDLVARGGMGEVYRADDLKLSEPVALKFLPPSLANNPTWLERFLEEVRVARNVSHPNVCRVYDVGEQAGEHFLTMEYVEGETLASLQQRIGRLPIRKAEQVAQQLCAGLAAIHDQGILHRDLKPSNIMIDNRGQVKVTDFGLAAAEEIQGMQAAAGTPGYVAPESLAGVEATVRSDIYQLGLLLFEVFTGRPAYIAAEGQDLLQIQRTTDPPAVTTIVPDVKPRVERIIQQCLERDPDHRPASARQVAAQLPGGDPLREAIAAGETPSPTLVAMGVAGQRSRMEAGTALALVGVFAIFVAVAIWLGGKGASLIRMAPLDKPPDVLADNARSILTALGYDLTVEGAGITGTGSPEAGPGGGSGVPVNPGHEAWGMDVYDELLSEIEHLDRSPTRWERLRRQRPAPIDFWYRWSPLPIGTHKPTGIVTMSDPAPDVEGMIAMRLTPAGKLRDLEVIDKRTFWQIEPATGLPAGQAGPPAPPPSWPRVFDMAGLDITKFKDLGEEGAQRIPPVFATKRHAWLGAYPESPDMPLRVEAATLSDKLVSFRTVEPDLPRAQLNHPPGDNSLRRTGVGLGLAIMGLTLVGGVFLAWRNTLAKRGDRVGATRAAVFIGGATFVSMLLTADTLRHEDAGSIPLGNLAWMLSWSVMAGLILWVLYVGVEPYVRRLWPETIVSWTRLVQGRVGDPLVGQSLLFGSLLGAAALCIVYLNRLTPGWLGLPPARPYISQNIGVGMLEGPRRALGYLIESGLSGIQSAMLMLVGVVLLKMLLRRTWAALVVFGAISSLGWAMRSATTGDVGSISSLLSDPRAWGLFGISWMFMGALVAAGLLVLVRYGVVALMVGAGVFLALGSTPLTLNMERWYAGIGMFCLAVVFAVPAYGAVTATTGRFRPV